MKPLLFLDVDGPLHPFLLTRGHRDRGYRPYPSPTGRVWLNRHHGPVLAGLGASLVWATSWGALANEWIAPPLGLPPLPICPDSDVLQDGVHEKVPAMVEYAAGAPFVWVDDEAAPADAAWARQVSGAPCLAYRADPARGLGACDVAALARWIRGAASGRMHSGSLPPAGRT